MKGTRWSSRTVALPAAVFVIVLLGGLVLAGSTDDDAVGLSAVGLIVIGLLLAVLVTGVVRLAVLLAGVDPDAQSIADRMAIDADGRRLLARWLERTRWSRNLGGCAGLVWWVLGTSMQGDVLLYGVGGVALGSMAAQLHHVRRSPGPRTASLDRRTLADYLPVAQRRRMIGVAGIAATMSVCALALDGTTAAAPWAAGALAVLGAAHAVQLRVAGRSRPALASGLVETDDLARTLAVDRGLAAPATYCALAFIAHGAGHLEPALGGVAGVIAAGAWIYALVAWWRNRRLGLDHVLALPAPAPS